EARDAGLRCVRSGCSAVGAGVDHLAVLLDPGVALLLHPAGSAEPAKTTAARTTIGIAIAVPATFAASGGEHELQLALADPLLQLRHRRCVVGARKPAHSDHDVIGVDDERGGSHRATLDGD